MSAVPLPTLPRLKTIYDVLYLNERIRLGSGPSYADEIVDPDGSYAALVRILDGTRSVSELQGQLTESLDPDEVLDALRQLLAGGFLEDAAEVPPDNLSGSDLKRYAPNLDFFRTVVAPGESCFTPQSKLKDTRVLLLGLGGIGSNVCMALAELGIGHIFAVDFDRVELSNLNRQVLYSTDVIGQRKADAARQRIRSFNPDIEFEVSDRRLTCLEDVREAVDQARPDFVFCLADKPNGLIDFWVNEVCVQSSVPYAAASVSARVGTAYTVVPGKGPCYQCRIDSEIALAPELQEPLDYIRENHINARNAAMGPPCMFLAYFLSYEMLRHRLDFMGEILASHRLLEVDFVTFAQQWHDFERRPDCRVCGAVPAVGMTYPA
ncbi:HesA/MoeB/ThiF family protein [Jatrophihabitans sp.]|uniref:HesA/MoeB/ThiF family protein n=1 Tax=Jatrophihabitans sp. TaxID=1932789 RepID=UPI002C60536D|nr:ThiF family adenylyltransferase [Jatrophihabitans sp.]